MKSITINEITYNLPLVILPEGNIEETSKKKMDLDELQSIVGGYIEVVRLKGEIYMVVNEDGIRMSLPINNRATFLYRTKGNNPNGTIYGNAIITADLD